MRLPFLQLESDIIAHGAAEVSHLAGCSTPQALGHIALVRAWAVSHASDEAPPDGWVEGESAGRRIEAAAHWTGEKGALVQALIDAGHVRQEGGGLRVLHLECYVQAWNKNRTAKERMRTLRERSANTGERLAKFGQQTQTQTQKKEESSSAPPVAAPPLVLAVQEAERPPEKPRRHPPAKRPEAGQGDPRHAQLVAHLVHVFSEAKGRAYGFQGGRDAKLVTELLALADQDERTRGDVAPDEVVRRWRIALAWDGFPACSTLAALKQNWNYYAAPQLRRASGWAAPATPSSLDSFDRGLPGENP